MIDGILADSLSPMQSRAYAGRCASGRIAQQTCPGGCSDAGELVAESTGGQLSSRLLSMRSANALLELPRVRAHAFTWHLLLLCPVLTLSAKCCFTA